MTKSELNVLDLFNQPSFHALMCDSPDYVVIIDKDHVIRYVNNIPGDDRERVIGKDVYSFVPKLGHLIIKGLLKKVFEKGETVEYKTPAFGPIKKVGWYSGRAGPIRQNDEVVASIIIARDITQGKEAEDTIRESEEKYRTLFQMAGDAILTVNRNGDLIDWNRSAENLLGYTNEEFSKLHGSELVDPTIKDDPDHEHHTWVSQLETKGKFTIQTRWIKKDRSIINVSVTGTPVPIEGGDLFQVIGRDITERAETEQKLKQTEQFLTTVFDNLPDMIFVKDAEELRFVNFNKAGEDLLGYKREDLIGKNDYDFFPKEQADFFTGKDRDVLSGRSVVDIPEEPIDTKHGRKLLHTKKVPVLDEEGKPKYLLGISRDITEWRKMFEENIRLQQQLEEYTKQLEHKVKHLETQQIGLNEREKLILTAITNHPSYTDQELAGVTGTKRSTITSIRNRLKRDGWYKLHVLPSLTALGFECLHLMYKQNPGVSLREFKEVKSAPHCFYAMESPQCNLLMCAYKNVKTAHKTITEALQNEEVKRLMTGMQQARFLSPTSDIYAFFDFAPVLNNLFGYSFEQSRMEPEEMELSKNEQEVMYAIVRNPEADNDQIQRLTRLSKPTIIKIKRKLFETGLLRYVVVPNLKKLGVIYGSVIYKDVRSPNYDYSRFNKVLAEGKQTFLGVSGIEQFIGMSIYRDYKTLEHMALKQINHFQERFQTLESPELIHFREPKVHKFDFAGLLKQHFALEVDY